MPLLDFFVRVIECDSFRGNGSHNTIISLIQHCMKNPHQGCQIPPLVKTIDCRSNCGVGARSTVSLN